MSVKKQFGIKLKITVGFSMVFIILSLLFNLYCYRQIRKLLIEDNDQYILAKATNLLSKTEVSPVIIPLPDKNTSIRVMYHSNGKQYTVFESPGIIKNIRTPLQTGVSDTLGMRVAYLINSSDENPAELITVSSADQLNTNLHFLLLLLIICSLISVLVAGTIAYILAVYLLTPVQRIIDAAKIINTNQLHDIIPVKNTNDELQELTETINNMLLRIDESVKQQQNFFSSASHELKTPLAIMKAELEVNLKKVGLNHEINTLLNSQLTEINRLQQVVQEFLLVSQLKSGGLILYKEEVDISTLILKLFNRLLPLFQQKNQTTEINFHQEMDSFIVNADQDKLWIVLMNLLENAIKYGNEGTLISCNIQQTVDANFMQISITNIIAEEKIPTENLQHAFHRENIQQNGAGLGLWLCHEIIKLHAGKMEIKSSGFKFEVMVYLPMD